MAAIEIFVKFDPASSDWCVDGDRTVFTCFNSPGTPPLQCIGASVRERFPDGIDRIREIPPAELGLVLSPEITHLKIPVGMDVSRLVGFWLQLERLQPRR